MEPSLVIPRCAAHPEAARMSARLVGTNGLRVWVCMRCGAVTGGAPAAPVDGVVVDELDPDSVITAVD